jgi:hypothetical protein
MMSSRRVPHIVEARPGVRPGPARDGSSDGDDRGAAASVTMRSILLWYLDAPVTAGPALALLYVLGQRGELGEDEEPATPAPSSRTELVQ